MAAVGALLAAPGPAWADYDIHTGSWLLQKCQSSNLAEQSFCLGYISAGFAGMQVLLLVNDTDFCVPDPVTQGQMQDVVVDYLRRHPKDRHKSAVVLIGSAIADAWPCVEAGFNGR